MKIENIRFGMLKVPLKTPFKTAMRTVDEIEDVVLAIDTDTGHTGYGSAPAQVLIAADHLPKMFPMMMTAAGTVKPAKVFAGETHGSIIEAINKVIAPKLIGQEIENLNGLVDTVQKAIVRNFSAKAAVEIAIYDLFGQLYEAPLYKLLGGGENVITTDITISVDYIDKMVEDALKAIDLGFETLKVKVGKDPNLEITIFCQPARAAGEVPAGHAVHIEAGGVRDA